MKYAILYSDGKALARIRVADRFFRRLKGLMGEKDIKEGLLLHPCAQIHTYFMREPIDVIYLDKHGRVLSVEEAMEPGRTGFYIHGCQSVLEMPAYRWRKLGCSEQVRILEVGRMDDGQATG